MEKIRADPHRRAQTAIMVSGARMTPAVPAVSNVARTIMF
jgi:hypothetical protein